MLGQEKKTTSTRNHEIRPKSMELAAEFSNKRNFIVSTTTWLKSQHFPKTRASNFLKYILNFQNYLRLSYLDHSNSITSFFFFLLPVQWKHENQAIHFLVFPTFLPNPFSLRAKLIVDCWNGNTSRK